ncbi:haloacid dehalogenase type II [Halosolutus amylolyticus]|uniref:Haloacid dehalogenase type II n=1 Tax=Halosolutus amylolyticus TaxID=2932267 RepID=A0ABD5PKR4_9EURY|nr:haloacid dehalogenase type II [Halosolutus amylolyticus]
MAFDPDLVTTITFDSYSTLVDVDAVESALGDHPDVGDPEPISKTWRERSMQYTLVGNHLGNYKRFYDVNRDALAYALAVHGVEATEDEREAILATYHDLEVFDDVRDGIERLRDGGYDCYVLSNGNPEMLASMVESAEIGDLVEDTISAHERATFKPDADLYRHAAGRTGTPIQQIAHVAALWFDVQGAIHAGMQGVRLDRKGTPWEPFGSDPDLTIETIDELAAELGV